MIRKSIEHKITPRALGKQRIQDKEIVFAGPQADETSDQRADEA